MRLVRPTLAYFAIVFGAGFVLGVLRVLVLVPLLDTRAAELLELPLMILVIVLAAHWTTRRFAGIVRPSGWLGVGFMALVLVLAADLAVAVGLRGMSPAEAFTDRDPVSGRAYYGSLVLFAVMP